MNSSEPPATGHDWAGRLGRILRKELFEILRDRRTILTLVLMPVLLYPLLSITFQQFFLTMAAVSPSKAKIGFVSEKDRDSFDENLYQPVDRFVRAKTKTQLLPLEYVVLDDDPEVALRTGAVDLVIKIPETKGAKTKKAAIQPLDILFLAKSSKSQNALTWVQRIVNIQHNRILDELLELPNVPAHVRYRLHPTGVTTREGDGLISLPSVIPLILILMTITGAVYPAIDLTAGERERGTLEMLVAAPVPRLLLLFAKYLTVLILATLTALINLGAMLVTILGGPLARAVFGEGGASPILILELLGLLLLFAAFFSAVLLCLTSFARSFKEAQAYLVPLMLVSMAPGIVGLIPGLQLTPGTAVTPLLNMVLLCRDLLNRDVDPALAVLAIGATLLYAATAIALAARIFGAEGVLYSEQSSWGDVFRRPTEQRSAATLTTALFCLALLLPLQMILQAVGTGWALLDARVAMFLPPVFSAILFGAWPAFIAWRNHLRWISSFRMTPASPLTIVGAVLIGGTFWLPLLWIMQRVFPGLEFRQEQFKDLLESVRESQTQLGPWIALVGIIPALFEEWFFRGLFYQSLRQRLAPSTTILVTALAFAVAHVLMGGALGFERLVPSFILGLILGWICEASGSVFPGMILHGLHNGILLAFANKEEYLSNPMWLGISVLGSAVGIAIVYLGRKKTD